jgi:hypothetical protein
MQFRGVLLIFWTSGRQALPYPIKEGLPVTGQLSQVSEDHACLGGLGWHYREAFRAAATCVMRAP